MKYIVVYDINPYTEVRRVYKTKREAKEKQRSLKTNCHQDSELIIMED